MAAIQLNLVSISRAVSGVVDCGLRTARCYDPRPLLSGKAAAAGAASLAAGTGENSVMVNDEASPAPLLHAGRQAVVVRHGPDSASLRPAARPARLRRLRNHQKSMG